MKIVFVINTLQIGGAAKMLKYVANLSLSIFNDVTIIDIYDDTYKNNDLCSKIEVKTLGLWTLSRLKRQVVLVPAIRRAIKKENPNYVFSFVGHVNVISRIATIGMKNVIFMSSERGDPYTQSFFWQKMTKWAYNLSDYCFFQLQGACDFFSEKVREHSFIIPNPFVQSDFLEPYSGRRNKTIVSAGRFAKEKCYDVLIKAFHEVSKLYPDYKLILFGDGPMLEDYKRLVDDLNIRDRVEFPGYVESVSHSVYKEGIFVLSSLYEGIPNALIEAMSVGIPCISTNCTPGGPYFLTKGGERALLIPVNNVRAMADAILTFINDESLAKRFGRKAIEVTIELREEKITEMWINAFSTILKSKNRL